MRKQRKCSLIAALGLAFAGCATLPPRIVPGLLVRDGSLRYAYLAVDIDGTPDNERRENHIVGLLDCRGLTGYTLSGKGSLDSNVLKHLASTGEIDGGLKVYFSPHAQQAITNSSSLRRFVNDTFNIRYERVFLKGGSDEERWLTENLEKFLPEVPPALEYTPPKIERKGIKRLGFGEP